MQAQCKIPTQLKHDEEEAFEVRFFPINQLPVNLNQVDQPVIKDYIKNAWNRI